jgi:hypothetical protein
MLSTHKNVAFPLHQSHAFKNSFIALKWIETLVRATVISIFSGVRTTYYVLLPDSRLKERMRQEERFQRGEQEGKLFGSIALVQDPFLKFITHRLFRTL